MRHIVKPFVKGRMLEDARPIGEVVDYLKGELSDYAKLKEDYAKLKEALGQ